MDFSTPPGGATPNSDPPKGPPWDSPMESAEWVFVDLEMTGLKPDSDRVIEMCVERVRGDRDVAALRTLIRPECGSFGNAHIHGIKRESVALAPAFRHVADHLVRLLDGAILVAHGARWDVAFLEAELRRAGRSERFPHCLDTLALCRKAWDLPSYRLAAVCEALDVEVQGAHRAAEDVRCLRAVFREVISVLRPEKPRDLWQSSRKRQTPVPIEALLAAQAAGAAVKLNYRAGKHRQELHFVIREVRTDLDPPRVLGYLLPTRGRRELRADRIYAVDATPAKARG